MSDLAIGGHILVTEPKTRGDAVDSKEQVTTKRSRSRLLRVSWILLAAVPLVAWVSYSALMAVFDCVWMNLLMGEVDVLSCTVHSSNIDYGLVQNFVYAAKNVGDFANFFIVPIAVVLLVADVVTTVQRKRNRTS